MKRVVLCLWFALALAGLMFAGGCTGEGGYVHIYGEVYEYDICPRCHQRHAPGKCPDEDWNCPQYCPPHHEHHHGHHHGCR